MVCPPYLRMLLLAATSLTLVASARGTGVALRQSSCQVTDPTGCVDEAAIKSFFPSYGADEGKTSWMSDAVTLIVLEGTNAKPMEKYIAENAASRTLADLQGVSDACGNIGLIPSDFKYCMFDAANSVQSLGGKVPDNDDISPSDVNPFGICAAFHIEHQILSFGLNGRMEIPSKPGSIEITEFSMSGKNCATETLNYWNGAGSSGFNDIDIKWNLAMAAVYTFGFEGGSKLSATLKLEGKLFLDLDYNDDGTIISPTSVVKQLIGPLSKGSGNANAGDFAVLITGSPKTDLTFKLTKSIEMTFSLDEWAQADMHALLLSEGTGKDVKFSAKLTVSIGSLDELLQQLIKQSLAKLKEAACNVFKFLEVIPQIKDFCQGDRRFYRRQVSAGVHLHVEGVKNIKLRVEGLSDNPFIMQAGEATQGLVFCVGDTCSGDTCMSDEDCGEQEWCDNSKFDTVGPAFQPNKCKPLLENGQDCTDFVDIGGRGNACRSGICCTTCQHKSCCEKVCNIGQSKTCDKGALEDEGGEAKCCTWGQAICHEGTPEKSLDEGGTGEKCSDCGAKCFARSTLACRLNDHSVSPHTAYAVCSQKPQGEAVVSHGDNGRLVTPSAQLVPMEDLNGGDVVLSAQVECVSRFGSDVQGNSLFFDRLLINQHKFAGKNGHDTADVVILHTEQGGQLTVTPDHLIYLDGKLQPARQAKAGSRLSGVNRTHEVVRVTSSSAAIINPLTSSGTILAFPSTESRMGAPPLIVSTYGDFMTTLFANQPLRHSLLTYMSALLPEAAQAAHDHVLEPIVKIVGLPEILAQVPIWVAPGVWVMCDILISILILLSALGLASWHTHDWIILGSCLVLVYILRLTDRGSRDRSSLETRPKVSG